MKALIYALIMFTSRTHKFQYSATKNQYFLLPNICKLLDKELGDRNRSGTCYWNSVLDHLKLCK